MVIRKYLTKDLTEMIKIWNAVVEIGRASCRERVSKSV